MKNILSSVAATIFMWLLMVACVASTLTHAVKSGDVLQIAVVILMVLDAVLLFIRYRK